MSWCGQVNVSSQLVTNQCPAFSTPGVRSAPWTEATDSRVVPELSMAACEVLRSVQSTATGQQLVITLLVLTLFVVTKSYYNHMRRQMARCTVFVIGAGPTGLTAALLATQNPHVTRVVVYEELTKAALVDKSHQVQFNRRTREFLSCLGVDFDSLEGVLEGNIFYSRVGVYLDYLLNLISLASSPVSLQLGTKFSRDKVAELENYPGRKIVIASDGSSGPSARLLGLSDEFVQNSCQAFGAVASMDRLELGGVPLAERRVHGLMFDLTAYGIDLNDLDITAGFSLKIFGSSRHRHMSLALPRSDSNLVRRMRLVLDRSMMRNIFVQCFNCLRLPREPELSEAWALRHLQFSARLFDVKLFQRLETVAYFQDTDLLVMVEGEAARCCNYRTGLDVNMAMAGLSTVSSTLSQAACALTDWDMSRAMLHKAQHSVSVCRHYVRSGFKQDVFARSS